jgi:hypothetical protein
VNGDGYFRGGNLFVASPAAPSRTYEIRAGGRQEIYNRNDFVHYSGSNVQFVLNSDEFGGGGNDEFFISDGNKGNIKFILEGTSGNVGIGTASPEAKLDVRGGIHFRNSDTILAGNLRTMVSDEPNDYDEELVICLGASADDRSSIFIGPNPSGALAPKGRVQINAKKLLIYHANVGIGTENPTEKLDVDGTARLRSMPTGTGTTVHALGDGTLVKLASSKRYKTNIEALEINPDAVLELRPVSFQYKSSGQQDIGLIAEEVEEQVKDLVIYDNQGRPDAVRYDKVSLYLLAVVKELKAENTQLKERLETLERAIQPHQLLSAKEVQP